MVMARAGRVISVGGGDGVGKSVVATNLAVALARDGARVVLVDRSPGGDGQRARFGLARSGPGVAALQAGALPDLAAAAVETGVPGLRLVPAGDAGAAGAPPDRRPLVRAVRALDADVVVVDAGAGDLALFDTADLRLVVMTPRLAAAEGAYALLRGAVLRELHRLAAATGQQARLAAAVAVGDPAASTARLLALLAQEDAPLAASLQAGLSGFGARLVGNQIVEARDTGLVFALSRMAHDFLGIAAPVLASLRASGRLHDSASGARPYLLLDEVDGEECAVTFRSAARALRAAPLARPPAASTDHDVPPPGAPVPPAALPVDVAGYQRAYHRHLVDLPATLVYPGGLLRVLLKDVSEGGALLELDRPPPVATRITLVVHGLGDHPGLACVVRHSEPGRRRAGVQFQCEREEGRRLAEAIQGLGIDRMLDARSGTGRCL